MGLEAHLDGRKSESEERIGQAEADNTGSLENRTVLTVYQAAERLHVHPNTLRRWSTAGFIPYHRTSAHGNRRYYESDVMDYVRQNYPQNGVNMGSSV